MRGDADGHLRMAATSDLAQRDAPATLPTCTSITAAAAATAASKGHHDGREDGGEGDHGGEVGTAKM